MIVVTVIAFTVMGALWGAYLQRLYFYRRFAPKFEENKRLLEDLRRATAASESACRQLALREVKHTLIGLQRIGADDEPAPAPPLLRVVHGKRAKD